ncbi:tetratricopeptide repeat protein [Ketobacter alkanivorans]|uniref:Uncharacterized protein n=1 Tax=Ketobacter alkanivorans TaxID=1917421 RepID=A0A2K9LGA4_9GAMM|nr:tetratricopeptide repeat protein [Ketobacter alkanivorans]AUM11273.1 hypothetical protein Kalk_01995 [Ketobacter alkanivorans]
MRSLLIAVALVLIAGCASNASKLGDMQANGQTAQEKIRAQLSTHYDLGESLYKAGKLGEAEAEFLKMLALTPGEPNACYRLGTIAFKLADYEKSAAYFEDTIRANPKHFKAHFNLASIRLMQSENHFKYYAALVDPDTDIQKVSQLVADIDKFNNKQLAPSNEQTLDNLATTIKK